MKTILVLGGYGTFGGRIAERAAAAGFQVLVAGRSLAKATAFCAGRDRLVPIALDRDTGLNEAILDHSPFALVDAVGPFQGADYAVARAAIAGGCHYVDIADGRDFVTGIAALDGLARAAGVSILSGASSLPALSGAVVARLAMGLDDVRGVDIALSASSRGTAGRSVTAAILSYLGKPVRLRRGGRWTVGYGWQELRRQSFEIEGQKPLRRRLVALADVPDLDLLPERLPGRPAVSFYAGTDVRLHVVGLWFLSWPVRWGWIKSATALAGPLSYIQNWTRWAGSKRSAMEIRLFGSSGARRVERRWTLIAGQSQGPEIPALAAPLILSRLADGAFESGASDASALLCLDDFQPSLESLATVQAIVEIEQPPPLYARNMGAHFQALPAAVRDMHDLLFDGGAGGMATVVRGRSWLAHLIATLFGFPGAGEHKLHVAFIERGGRERWIRDFSGKRFSSLLSQRQDLLVERFGAIRFGMALPADGAGLRMIIKRWWLGPIPLPLALAPRSIAREWEEDGRFHFDVSIALPLIGPLVHYRGWLEKERVD